MNYCIYCQSPLETKTSWKLFLGLERNNVLCSACEEKLIPINGEICERCGRSFLESDTKFRKGSMCVDCLKWEKDKEWQGVLSKNRSIYLYNDFLKELIYQYKYRGDAKLADIFAEPMKRIYEKYFSNHVIVPIPLSKERQYERGFNQAELLAYHIGEPIFALSRRNHEEKQSKKSREERLASHGPPLFVTESSFNKYIENYDIIIIDDIYTTGATIVQAARTLKYAGAKSISSITIAR